MHDQDDVIVPLRESAEEFVAAQTLVRARGLALDQPTLIDCEQWAQMARMGWLGLTLPESLGGSGLGVRAAATLCEVFGRHLYAQPFVGAALMPAHLIACAQGHPRQQEWAQGLLAASTSFAVAWQEDVADFTTRAAVMRLNRGLLNGNKRFVVAAEDETVLLVSAWTGEQTVLVAVDAGAPGVGMQRWATAQGHVAELNFKDVRPLHAQPLMMGDRCEAALRSMVSLGRVCASAQLAGLARGCLDKTIEYVSQRVQFGRKIGSFQSVAHRCVDQYIGVQLAEVVWQEAVNALEADRGDEATQAKVCAAKARCSEVALEMGRLGVQLHGAMGFTEEADIGMYLRGAMQYASWLGGAREMRRQFLPAFLDTQHCEEAARG